MKLYLTLIVLFITNAAHGQFVFTAYRFDILQENKYTNKLEKTYSKECNKLVFLTSGKVKMVDKRTNEVVEYYLIGDGDASQEGPTETLLYHAYDNLGNGLILVFSGSRKETTMLCITMKSEPSTMVCYNIKSN